MKNVTAQLMKNVVVPIDFSEDSLKGLELACLLTTRATLNLQMVYVLTKSRDNVPSDAEDEYREAERKFKKIQKDFKHLVHNKSKLEYIIKKGKIYQEVVGQAHAINDCIIVASTHGASGFEELFIGSNAYKIITSTVRPVLTIRKGSAPKHIKKIVVPVDIVSESRQTVSFASFIAELFEAEIYVLSVSSSKNKKLSARLAAYNEQICNFLKNKDIACHSETLVGDSIPVTIVDYCDKIEADLVAIINESDSSFSELVLGSYAQQMISRSSVPVLTIRAKSHTIKGSFSTLG